MPRFQAAGRVVHAAVNHLAVVRAGAHAGPGLALEDDTLRPRSANDHAVASPTTPAPMTAVSICSIFSGCCSRITTGRSVVAAGNSRSKAGGAQSYFSVYNHGLRLLILVIDRVLITGANGQLAAFIVQAFADREVIAPARQTST